MATKDRYTAKQMINALKATSGIKSAAARYLGCNRITVHRYCENHPTVQAACDEARASIIDRAESGLVKKLNADEWPAIKFVLTTIGKDRGYVERQEHSGKIVMDILGIDFGGDDDTR